MTIATQFRVLGGQVMREALFSTEWDVKHDFHDMVYEPYKLMAFLSTNYWETQVRPIQYKAAGTPHTLIAFVEFDVKCLVLLSVLTDEKNKIILDCWNLLLWAATVVSVHIHTVCKFWLDVRTNCCFSSRCSHPVAPSYQGVQAIVLKAYIKVSFIPCEHQLVLGGNLVTST